MKKLLSQELLTLVFVIIIFLLVRALHFAESLNFSTDQAVFSSRALDIFNNRELTLTGPGFSLEIDGRYMFQGPAIYYMQLLFLLLGSFEPIKSSYMYVYFAGLMIIPLYFGVKMLINKNAALVLVIIYALVPFYINYTRFLWNPNFQFSLLPAIFLLMGLYKKYKSRLYFFLLWLVLGFVLQFHYSFLLVIVLLFLYYLILQKINLVYVVLAILGSLIGFLPLVLFELRNNFYNLQTLILFIHNKNQIFTSTFSLGFSEANYHYFLSISFFLILFLVFYFRKALNLKAIFSLFIILLTFSVTSFINKPEEAYGMSNNWNYLKEAKVYQIIAEQNLTNFNIFNQIYDSKAHVQKYLLKKNGINIKEDDYTYNQYMYIITNRKDFMEDLAYEIREFTPYKLIGLWNIDNLNFLYLVQRL